MEPEKCCDSGCTPCERDPDGKEPLDLCNYCLLYTSDAADE